jgi:uncharacterized protein YjbJ (UPF0337 family)
MHGTDDIIQGKWEQVRGQIRMWWGDLTDDDVEVIAGSRDKLQGRLRERYGWTQERADSEIDRFVESMRVPTS